MRCREGARKMMMRKLLSLLTLILLIESVPLCAQQKLKFSIASFEMDQLDMTARNEAYKKVDGSGSLYAIIKVTSNNPDDRLNEYNFSFGNLRHIVEEHDDELWIYVQKNAKMVTISRAGYTTISKYDLKTTIESGRTYVMQLSTTGPVVYTQMVQFVVMPANVDAVVMVKSSRQDATEELLGTVDATGQVAKSLPFGTYTYKVITGNYHVSEGRFTLKDRTQIYKEEVTLRPNFSTITLRTNPDAEIYVNGEKIGIGSWTGILRTGNYQVECRQERHKSTNQYISVEENKNRTIDLTPPTPITGTVAITSRPLGASITIDGKDYGMTPQNINDIIIGHHTVTLSKRNYKTENLPIEVLENQTADVDVTLSDMAMMTIKSRPTNADLYIDGQHVGKTPYSAEMASGDYDIRLAKAKYCDMEKRIHLDSANPELSFSLSQQYVQPTSFYLNASFQAVSLMGPEIAVGTYISGFNVEGFLLYGINKSETIFWNYTGDGEHRPMQSDYTATAFGGRVGYGLIAGPRLRITPQAGLSVVGFADDNKSTEGHVVSGTIGIRADAAVASHAGIFITPEYAFALKKSKAFELLEPISSKIKAWGNGFNIRIGLSIFF